MTSNLLERDPAVETTVVTPNKHLDKQPHPPTAPSAPKPTNRAGWSLMSLATVATMLIAAFGGGWWFANNQASQHERMSLPESDLVLKDDSIVVTTEPIIYRDVQRYVEAVGTLNGFEEITLSSKQEGRVLRIHHDLSSVVKPGELLLELDPTDAKLAYDQANRSVQTELAKWGFKSVPGESEDLQQLPTVVSARLRFELGSVAIDSHDAAQGHEFGFRRRLGTSEIGSASTAIGMAKSIAYGKFRCRNGTASQC